jgi:hypothetical protein
LRACPAHNSAHACGQLPHCPAATPVLGGRPGKNERPHPFNSPHVGHPIHHHVAGPMSVDPDKAGRRHAQRRLPHHTATPEAANDLNHQRVCLVPGRPSMRRILVGLEVVRPRCAAGAPTRPRLRSTAPDTGPRTRPNKQENDQGSTFTGVLNTDKDNLTPGLGTRQNPLTGRLNEPEPQNSRSTSQSETSQATTSPVRKIRASLEGDERELYGPAPAASQPPTDSCARYFLP